MLYLIDDCIKETALIMDFKNNYFISTESILNKVREIQNKIIVNNAINEKHLKIIQAKKEFLEKTRELNLNDEQKELIAIALELKKEKNKFRLISKNKQLREIAFKLRIPFTSIKKN